VWLQAVNPLWVDAALGQRLSGFWGSGGFRATAASLILGVSEPATGTEARLNPISRDCCYASSIGYWGFVNLGAIFP